MISVLDDKRVYLEIGPIRMVLDVTMNYLRDPKLGTEIAKYVLEQFKKTLEFMPYVKGQKQWEGHLEELPLPLQKMLNAVTKCGDETMTPLAGVAGSFSDLALEKALELGCNRAIINNGGDIALRDLERTINVGIPLLNSTKPSYVISIEPNDGVRGICSSGFGGRSFTKGVADLAVILASDAAIADVCATHIANETSLESPRILRSYSEKIDSGTDIPGHLVTLKVGNLSEVEKLTALVNGYEASERLLNKGVIKGAFIAVGENMIKLPEHIDFRKI